MNITPQNLVSSINETIFLWQNAGLVLNSRTHKQYTKSNGITEITWGHDGYVLKKESFSSIAEYISLLENDQYSMLLSDGSLFQFSFNLKRNKIVKHRLCWYPAPVEISVIENGPDSISEAILDNMKNGEFEKLLSRGPIRFDYDEEASEELHPETHMHICVESCRIPVRTPLCINKFIKFIVENFYPQISNDSRLVTENKTWKSRDTLTENQKKRMHFNILQGI